MRASDIEGAGRGAGETASSAYAAGLLTMPSLQQAVWRRIEFTRYRKPHLVQYPRNATVLNPQHAANLLANQRDAAARGSSSTPETAIHYTGHGGGELEPWNHRRTAPKGADDDDPRYQPDDELLCRDQTFLHQVLAPQWTDRGSPILVGLENLGNTCYLNSVLQAIAHVPPLSQFLTRNFSSPHQATGAPIDFAFLIADTLRRMLTGSDLATRGGSGASSHIGKGSAGRCRVVRPSAIVGHLRGISKHLRLGQQCDAHEFYVNLMQAIQASLLFRTHGPKKFALRIAMSTPLMRLISGYLCSQVAWSLQEEVQALKRERLTQVAVDLEMAQRTRVSSHRGESERDRLVSNTYDPFTVLSLEIVGHSLHDCLRHFCRVEALDGKIYKTPRGVRVRATKSFRIHIPPPVLAIQLKRFDPSRSKVNKRVEIPLRLDVQPYCTQGLAAYGGMEAVTTYDLCAVCVHEGTSLNYGHYVAFVKLKNGAWANCNDEHVSVVSVEKVLQSQAYLLFYTKCSTDVAAAVRGERAQQPQPQQQQTLGEEPTARNLSSARLSSQSGRKSPSAPITSLREGRLPPPPVENDGESLFDLGEALTGEEAQRLLDKIRQRRKLHESRTDGVEPRVNSSKDAGSYRTGDTNDNSRRELRGDDARTAEDVPRAGGDDDARKAGNAHRSLGAEGIRNEMKRHRGDALLPSVERSGEIDDDDDDDNSDARRSLQHFRRLNRAVAVGAKMLSPRHSPVVHTTECAAAPTFAKSSRSSAGNPQRPQRADPRSELTAGDNSDSCTAATAASPSNANDMNDSRIVAVGPSVLAEWDASKRDEQRTTVDRKRWDARLRLRVRDEQYEREMDKGRVAKKGRREQRGDEGERGGEARANPFQTRGQSFDRRGRQQRSHGAD